MEQATSERSYVIKTLSISNDADKKFLEKYRELVKYAKRFGHRRPSQAQLASHLFKMAEKVNEESFFK